VQALDAIDGMPVLDLKPYMREFGPRRQVRQAIWFTELMAGYWNTRAASSVHGPGRIALAHGPPPGRISRRVGCTAVGRRCADGGRT